MANHTIDVYYFMLSPPSRATLMLIRALGIKHNVKVINIPQGEQLSPEYIKINPLHTVPAINDNGFILWDSAVIMKYLANQYGKDDSLYPKDAKKSAIVDRGLYFNAGTLFPKFGAYVGPVLFGNDQPDPANAAKCEEAFQQLEILLGDQTWIAGQYMTIADFSTIALIATVEATGMFELRKYPNIWAWYQRGQSAMAGFGYEEINQAGATAFGNAFKSKLR